MQYYFIIVTWMKDAFEKKNLIGIVKTRVTKMTIYGKWGGGVLEELSNFMYTLSTQVNTTEPLNMKLI